MPRKTQLRKTQQISKVPETLRPAQFDPNFRVSRKMRYVANTSLGSLGETVDVASACEAMGMVCTTQNVSATPVFGFIRIRRIRAWGVPPTSPGTISEVAVVFAASTTTSSASFGTNLEHNDVSNSTAYVPYIDARPPPGCNAYLWQSRLDSSAARRTGVANNLFSLKGPAGAIFEIDVEIVAYDAGNTGAITTTPVSTGTLSAFAYAPLSGLGGPLIPQGVGYFT